MKAVLFDFNGTLYNDTRFHIEAWKNFMKKKLGLELTREEIIRRCIGPSNNDIFTDFFGTELSKEKRAEYSWEKENEYRNTARRCLDLKAGAAEFLDQLSVLKIPFALATASPIENVEFYLNEIGLNRWFTYQNVVYDDGNIRCKPEPDFYIEAAARIGAKLEDCIICEDSLTGVEAAIRAKAGRIIALEGTTDRQKLKQIPEIYAIAADFTDFEKYLY